MATETAKTEPRKKAPKADKKPVKAAKKTATAASYDVILSPVITEKSTIANSLGKYVFKVAVDGTKTQVKNAVEAIFGVEVTKVNVVNYDGKIKAFRGRYGRRNNYKKAIVTLKAGQSIDLAGGIKA